MANPVLYAELKHQRFVIQRSRSGWLWIGLAAALVVPALLASLIFSGAILASAFVPEALQLASDNEGTWFTVLMVVNLSLYPVVTLITLGLSANSIRREKAGKTWDALRLTHISNQQIIIGKWIASLRAMWFDHLMTAVVRIGWVATIVVISSTRLFTTALNDAPIVIHFLLLAGITVIYAALDAALTVSLGIVSALPENGSTVGGLLILVLRSGLIVVQFIGFSLTIAIMLGGEIRLYLIISLAGFCLYGLLIWATLRVANALVD